MNFFGLNVVNLQGTTDHKIPPDEPALVPVRFLAGDAIQRESRTIRDITLWRFHELSGQGEACEISSSRGICLLRLLPRRGLLRHGYESE
jgi:hypothetical protein